MPVYSPNILEVNARLDDKRVFQTLPLIHTTSRADAWTGWMKAFNLHEPPATPRIEYGHFHVAGRRAPGTGRGADPEIIYRSSYPGPALRLAVPNTRSAGEYYMLTLNRHAQSHHVAVFRDWVRRQFREFRHGGNAPGWGAGRARAGARAPPSRAA